MENETTQTVKITMEERLRRSRQRIEELTAESKAKARRAVRITDNYAHDHPWRMVITGSALAFIAGMLVRETGARHKARRPIVLKREVKPVVKVQAPKQSKFELIHALIPLAALALKAMSVARSHPNAHHRA